MKKTFLFLALITISLSAFSQGIAFEENHNLKDALAKAKQENKLVFIDAYAVWCGPCKMMARDVFTQKEVGDYFNAHFVNLKLDMEKPENLDIAKKYDVKAYPTLLFLDAEGNVAHKALGGMPAAEFIKVAKAAGDTENNFQALSNKIKNGDRTAATIKKYLEQNPYDDGNGALIDGYFSTLPENEVYTQENWELFNEYVTDVKSPSFQYFLKNRDKVAQLVGKEKADNKIYVTMVRAYRKDPAQAETLKNIDPALFEKAIAAVQLDKVYGKFAKNKEDKTAWADLMKAAAPYMNSPERKPMELNNFAWMVYENYKKFNDKASLKNALGWAKRAAEQAPDQSYILDTYAHLLYASGKKKDALATAAKALELAKKSNDAAGIEAYTKAIQEFKK